MARKKSQMTDQDWKERLTPEQYRVLREKGTDPAFTGSLYNNKDAGMYRCAACGAELFSSKTKYDSGSGWPSFYEAVDPEKVELKDDNSHGMSRIEISCANCGGHLGHLFDDGPVDHGGQRFCVNSSALEFQEQK